jgi:sulfide:quinone oxidoreductase
MIGSRKLSPNFSTSAQIRPEDMASIAAAGFRSIINNRPDNEVPDQPAWTEVADAARANGLQARHIPITTGSISDRDIASFRDALAELPAPVLAFCGSGRRSTLMWVLANPDELATNEALAIAAGAGHDLEIFRERIAAAKPGDGQIRAAIRHDVVILGGGAAGIATAASLLRRQPSLDIAIVEPRETHAYQPGWTLVGAGVFTPEQTIRPMAAVMPRGVNWIRAEAVGIKPEANQVELRDGESVIYKMLIVATGNRLAWEEIDGLAETLGKNGVTSNYSYELAPYTWELVHGLKQGRALFTQPPMPIKCAGAPQKAMYLSFHEWERREILGKVDVEFHSAGAVLFGVPAYLPALEETVARYGIHVNLGSNLVAVDGPARKATFRTAQGELTRDFDMLHVSPPQKPCPVIAGSSLADEAGYVDVDQATMQHKRLSNVFALGDAGNMPNAKTAAAVRKQAPVVAVNALAGLRGEQPAAVYDGYGSCPLTVEKGRIVLAEFGYGGQLKPTFPTWLIDGTRPSRLAWILKKDVLPPIYWYAMLKGREWLVEPETRSSAAT